MYNKPPDFRHMMSSHVVLGSRPAGFGRFNLDHECCNVRPLFVRNVRLDSFLFCVAEVEDLNYVLSLLHTKDDAVRSKHKVTKCLLEVIILPGKRTTLRHLLQRIDLPIQRA